MRRPGNSAFTLIELLVVIAIIGILASILMPVFTRARGKGRQASCLSNLNQIGLALHMYADDHDEMFPLSTSSGPCSFWNERLEPYMKNQQIGTCPQLNAVSRQIPGMDHPYTWNYSMNACMCRRDLYGDTVLFDLARIQTTCDVARMMMATETTIEGAAPDFFIPNWWPYTQYHVFPHYDRAQILFVDGHVKSIGQDAAFNAYPGIMTQ
jgi:prepilin-type N-terminal cleavage/methylation domain-containing protein/prepilin-type processing-associated H-X9-DG protein